MVTYIDYWNQFWKVAELVPIPSSEVALYAYLLNECNSKYWKMPFPCASSKICESIRISKEALDLSLIRKVSPDTYRPNIAYLT